MATFSLPSRKVIGIMITAAKAKVYSARRIGLFSVKSSCTLRVLYARKSAATTGTATKMNPKYGKMDALSEHISRSMSWKSEIENE